MKLREIIRLNEQLDKLNETQIEGGDPVTAIKDGLYEGDDIGKVVLENLDEFNVDDIAKIMSNYSYYKQGAHELFPSAWVWSHENDIYPTKLAKALLRSNENEAEGLTDLFNIFYRAHGNMDKFGDAAKIWENNVKAKIKNVAEFIKEVDDDGAYAEQLFEELSDSYPELVESLRAELEAE